ncbi:hypothetical protein Anapl_07974 [Anas platyrhynchos]|uniref:Uncharacterized protein n=1 Tax=Anas platyrhynchos TaxID=8839 RepID=R0L8N3_ANAPL|nr:hypothetical protein Anapl_07974 [Anas platyrhynchos]
MDNMEAAVSKNELRHGVKGKNQAFSGGPSMSPGAALALPTATCSCQRLVAGLRQAAVVLPARVEGWPAGEKQGRGLIPSSTAGFPAQLLGKGACTLCSTWISEKPVWHPMPGVRNLEEKQINLCMEGITKWLGNNTDGSQSPDFELSERDESVVCTSSRRDCIYSPVYQMSGSRGSMPQKGWLGSLKKCGCRGLQHQEQAGTQGRHLRRKVSAARSKLPPAALAVMLSQEEGSQRPHFPPARLLGFQLLNKAARSLRAHSSGRDPRKINGGNISATKSRFKQKPLKEGIVTACSHRGLPLRYGDGAAGARRMRGWQGQEVTVLQSQPRLAPHSLEPPQKGVRLCLWWRSTYSPASTKCGGNSQAEGLAQAAAFTEDARGNTLGCRHLPHYKKPSKGEKSMQRELSVSEATSTGDPCRVNYKEIIHFALRTNSPCLHRKVNRCTTLSSAFAADQGFLLQPLLPNSVTLAICKAQTESYAATSAARSLTAAFISLIDMLPALSTGSPASTQLTDRQLRKSGMDKAIKRQQGWSRSSLWCKNPAIPIFTMAFGWKQATPAILTPQITSMLSDCEQKHEQSGSILEEMDQLEEDFGEWGWRCVTHAWQREAIGEGVGALCRGDMRSEAARDTARPFFPSQAICHVNSGLLSVPAALTATHTALRAERPGQSMPCNGRCLSSGMLGGEKQHSSTRVTLAPPNQGFGARCDFLVAYGGKKKLKKKSASKIPSSRYPCHQEFANALLKPNILAVCGCAHMQQQPPSPRR